MLTPQFFTNNRATLRSNVGSGVIAITSNGLQQRNNDSAFEFRQDSNFFYLTGLEEPNVVLIIDCESAEEFLILPKQTTVEIFFGGVNDRDEIAIKSGITTIYSHSDGWQRYIKLQQSRSTIYTIKPDPVQFTRQERMFTSPARRLFLEKLKRCTSKPIVYLYDEFIALRSIKQPQEIEMLKRAIAITKEGFVTIQAKMQPSMYEYEVEAELDYVYKKHNSRHGFAPPIIASGKNSTVLHYSKNTNVLKAGELVLMDVGAEVENYTADVSRTYVISGAMNSRQQAVYTAVKTVHNQSINLLRSGLLWKEYITEVERLMGEQLLSLKLITANTRDQIRHYFPHAVSHSLGLDTHDLCDYTKPMQENMVITVEPGIYIPEEGIGVRIEDDILITNNGAVNLSADIPY